MLNATMMMMMFASIQRPRSTNAGCDNDDHHDDHDDHGFAGTQRPWSQYAGSDDNGGDSDGDFCRHTDISV